MTLIKTSILTAISTLIRVITGFVINKLVSVYIGPSGLALIGQFQNFTGIVTTVSTGGINQGVVKYAAEYKDEQKTAKLFSSALLITLIASLITAIIIIVYSDYFSQRILNTQKYSDVFLVFGFTVILFGLNQLFLSILNGKKEIKKYILANIAGSIVALILTSILVIYVGLLGALYALVLNQSIVFFITLVLVVKSNWFHIGNFKFGLDKEHIKKLSHFSLMTLVSAVSFPVMQLIVRDYIGKNLGWDAAGYWQGINYISTMYLMLITTSLGVYYLPKLSELTDHKEIKEEIINGYKIILPIVMVTAGSIYLLRGFVISIAFTDTFAPMQELFLWQLIGDVIKIASWLLSYLLLAKAMTKVFIYTEIGFKFTFMSFAYLFISQYGLVGVTYAFALNYLLYLFTMIFIFRRVFR